MFNVAVILKDYVCTKLCIVSEDVHLSIGEIRNFRPRLLHKILPYSTYGKCI